jgi:hypothetical protein
VEAKDLHIGSLLQTEDGRVIDVDGVDKREGKFEVYNFKVEGFHTYFVSDLGILVHNADYKGINIQFGQVDDQIQHAFRHTDKVGLNREIIQQVIKNDLNGAAGILTEGLNKRSVIVDGITLDYSAYKLPDGKINVGRITPPR